MEFDQVQLLQEDKWEKYQSNSKYVDAAFVENLKGKCYLPLFFYNLGTHFQELIEKL